jgi:hypothetical protein
LHENLLLESAYLDRANAAHCASFTVKTVKYNRPSGAGRTKLSGDLLLMNVWLAKPIPSIWFIPQATATGLTMLQCKAQLP